MYLLGSQSTKRDCAMASSCIILMFFLGSQTPKGTSPIYDGTSFWEHFLRESLGPYKVGPWTGRVLNYFWVTPGASIVKAGRPSMPAVPATCLKPPAVPGSFYMALGRWRGGTPSAALCGCSWWRLMLQMRTGGWLEFLHPEGR